MRLIVNKGSLTFLRNAYGTESGGSDEDLRPSSENSAADDVEQQKKKVRNLS